MTYQNDHDFHFYSSENDGYRGGLGDYADPTPGQSQPPRPPRKNSFGKKAVALALTCTLLTALFSALAWLLMRRAAVK